MKSEKHPSPPQQVLYPYALDHKPGFFLGWFFYRLFKKVRADDVMRERLKQMHKEGTVIYSIKYRGKLDYLMYHYNFRIKRLPYPKLAFDLNISLLLPVARFLQIFVSQLSTLIRTRRIPDPYESGFYRSAVLQGTTSLLFLIDPKGFMDRFLRFGKERIQFLLETQKQTERPIFLVPLLALYTKTPEKDRSPFYSILFGFKDHPGTLRKIIVFFRHHREVIIDFGQPLNLKDVLDAQPADRPLQETATEIRTRLIEDIDNQKRVALGPIMKSKQQFKEVVLEDPGLTEKIKSAASGNESTLRRLRRKAGKDFDEIAADYNITYIQILHMGLQWLWKRLFEEIDVDTAALAKVREWARKGTLIFIPSHKSHIDYLVLNYFLYEHHLHIPRVAAGRNLAFWPVGHIFRKCGAFFIRRSFRQEKVYVEVFNRYIKALLEDGHPIEFFIEGGRSRNGKLVFPKTGFLSILLQAHQEGYCKDLIFVPASIAYDRVLEEKSYLRELTGAAKEQESFGQVIRARQFLGRKYGKVYIRFAAPFSLNEYLAGRSLSPVESRHALALHLVQSINAVTPATPLSLVSTAVLSNHRRGFLLSELEETTKTLLRFLRQRGTPLAPSLSDAHKAVTETVSLLLDWKVVDSLQDSDGVEETFYYVDEEKKVQLEYYKNSIIHCLIPHAFLAISLLAAKAEKVSAKALEEDYAILKHLFKNEFVFDEEEASRRKVLSMLDDFVEEGYLSGAEAEGTYRVTKLGYEKLPIWAGLAKTFVESYWIAVKSLSTKGRAGAKREDSLRHMSYLGKRLYRSGAVDHIGALSPLNFRNALAFLQKELPQSRPPGTEGSTNREKLLQLGHRLYELSHYG
ncbi:MAG: 1-acyl-sn-glycerol-3-phosphate acyltransferase [Deltaproteobacteria bacterium]|nr:1-acyl-sn-glycerol-3-phosphate acyltransferase [Deltaproteobacteria bacterium]